MSQETPLHLDRVGQIFIRAADVERATAFYRDVLGMKFLFAAPPKMAFFDCGGVRLMLGEAEADEFDHPASVIYYPVQDIHAACNALTGQQVQFRGEPHVVHRTDEMELWMVFLEDSEGNALALMSEVSLA